MKKLLPLLLIAAICLPLMACNDSEQYARYEKYDDLLEMLEDGDYDGAIDEIRDLADMDADDEDEGNGDFTAPPQTNDTPSLKVDETTVTKNGEFSIDFVNIAQKITPPTPDSYYSYYEADNGKVYVDFCFSYKNTSAAALDADEIIEAVLIYDGKYEYDGFDIIEEDNRGDFTYANISEIDPLCTEYLHYLFEVPEEVETSGKAILIEFTIDETEYTYKVR